MALLLVALGVQLLGGIGALLARASARRATALGVAGLVLGDLIGLVPVVRILGGAPPMAVRLPWHVPFGAFDLELDALSALFSLPVLGLSALAAVYGSEYLLAHERRQAAGTSWFFLSVLTASMEVVLLARNAVLFLVAWEAMALSSFFLVVADDDQPSVREAGWTYLVATHLGTACLLVLFVLLGHGAERLDFQPASPSSNAGVLFVLALVGFGTKAGLMPFHVWLPEAHPAAPSHVSAVMSGVMIATGIYGLLRVLPLLEPLPPWCAWVLVGVGAVSGVLGILSALAQRDLKRLLAYSSIENVGLITLALGLSVIGRQAGANDVAVLGAAAALFHVLTHAVMKGSLFLAAGTVVQATGTRDLEALGGLLRRLPRTGGSLFAAGAAISGLPPLACFASEVLLYWAAYRATAVLDGMHAIPAVVTLAVVALIGGLAAACFAKMLGIVLLGAPRSERVPGAHEPGAPMQAAVLVLATGCVLLGVLAPALLPRLQPVLVEVTALPETVVDGELARIVTALNGVIAVSGAFLLLAGLLAVLRRRLLAGRSIGEGPTWDCGYVAPSARMQYTGSSFAQPLAAVFARLQATRSEAFGPKGFFPASASYATATVDLAREHLYRPLFEGLGRLLARLRWLQHGRVQLYVLYVALTLIALLVWSIGGP